VKNKEQISSFARVENLLATPLPTNLPKDYVWLVYPMS